MSETTKMVGRIIASGYYDYQETRISTKNRIRDIIRKKAEGVEFDEVEEKKDEKSTEEKYTDKQLLTLWDDLLGDEKISKEEHKYVKSCWELADESEKLENKYKTAMMAYIKQEDVYNNFLQHIKGIGPVLSANLIKEFGECDRYENVSKLWAHAGHAVQGGLAPKKRKGEEIAYSPRLKTFVWKIGDCLIKSNKGIYRQIYDTQKEKYLAREYKKGELLEKYGKPYKKESTELSQGHAHNMAARKMRKVFLQNYWECARELAGLSTKGPFAEDMGHKSIIHWRDALRNESKNVTRIKAPKKKK